MTWPSSPRQLRLAPACLSCISSMASAPHNEVNKIELLDDDDMRAMIDDQLVIDQPTARPVL